MKRLSVWIAIAAAGQSRRMGMPKQLLPIDGVPMLRHVIRRVIAARGELDLAALRGCPCAAADLEAADRSEPERPPGCPHAAPGAAAPDLPAPAQTRGCPERPSGGATNGAAGSGSECAGGLQQAQLQVAVIAADDPELRERCEEAGVRWIVNPETRQGLSSTIRTAVLHAEREDAEALLILLGDQPDIDPSVVMMAVKLYLAEQPVIIQAKYADGPGHPVLFDRRLWPELLQLQGDCGARALIRSYREFVRYVESPARAPVDLDTPEEYAAYMRRRGGI
ncbi:nucleotidyltransferase family protein [Paenibacillus sp. 1P07SE]|uniref:nucleotidyltransferase family protein n=1 Tax=Paenibacillus sp. 1P07SE TaxID=3132209 RepID=UPI0039A6764E